MRRHPLNAVSAPAPRAVTPTIFSRPSRAAHKMKRSFRFAVLASLFAACGIRNGDDSGERSGALTASTGLGTALSGKIVSPAATAVGIAAATIGQAGVHDDGATSYRIPIWLPDGVAGLQPELAISYHSNGARGLLGPKWTISGLSQITRCSQTIAQNGQKWPVTFPPTSDTFCLDGKQLIRTTG